MGRGGDLGISDATIRHSKGLITWSLYRKKQTNKQKQKQKQKQERESQVAQSKHFFIKGG